MIRLANEMGLLTVAYVYLQNMLKKWLKQVVT